MGVISNALCVLIATKIVWALWLTATKIVCVWALRKEVWSMLPSRANRLAFWKRLSVRRVNSAVVAKCNITCALWRNHQNHRGNGEGSYVVSERSDEEMKIRQGSHSTSFQAHQPL